VAISLVEEAEAVQIYEGEGAGRPAARLAVFQEAVHGLLEEGDRRELGQGVV
jgi:hypothetical protein